jgi:hypothetical protein
VSEGDRLLAALQTTLSALEAGEVVAAALGAEAVASACASLSAGALTAAELASAQGLQARCEALALRRQESVVAELLQSATHQRATHAYGSTT